MDLHSVRPLSTFRIRGAFSVRPNFSSTSARRASRRAGVVPVPSIDKTARAPATSFNAHASYTKRSMSSQRASPESDLIQSRRVLHCRRSRSLIAARPISRLVVSWSEDKIECRTASWNGSCSSYHWAAFLCSSVFDVWPALALRKSAKRGWYRHQPAQRVQARPRFQHCRICLLCNCTSRH